MLIQSVIFVLLSSTTQMAHGSSNPDHTEQETRTNSIQTQLSSSWEYGVPTQTVTDSESDADPNLGSYLSEQLAPDPRSLFTSDENGNMGLIGQVDQFCLGGLCARINRRAYSYGLCGALFGASIGCVLAVLPVYICNDQIAQASDQAGVTPPDITFLAIPAALVGTPPGCVLGAGTGTIAGVLSAFLLPHDPKPAENVNNEDSIEDVGDDTSDGEDDHRTIRKERKPKKKKRREERESKDTSRSAQPVEDEAPARSVRDNQKATSPERENRPSIQDSKDTDPNKAKRDRPKQNDDRPETPKDSSKVKDDKKKVKKKKDKKPSKPRRSEGELDPNDKSGNPLPGSP